MLFFTTESCNKCAQLLPHIIQLWADYPNIKLRVIEHDGTPETTMMFDEYDVRSVPTVIFTKCASPIDTYSDIAPLDLYRRSFRILDEHDGD